MKLISTGDLKLWAADPASSLNLPELICRLIRSTAIDIKDLMIPLGKGVWRGGWDAVAICGTPTEFIPEGLSLWEFGTTEDCKAKANEEFFKRTSDPRGHDISKACFVFITPHVWEKKDEWIAERKSAKDNSWNDIKVYDGQKLVQWLIQSPVQSYWLSEEIQRMPNDGFALPMDFWDDWRKKPEYELIPSLVTTGREGVMRQVVEMLKGQPCVIPVQASAREESIAFFIATILQMDIEQREDVMSRALIVESEKAFKVITTNKNSLILLIKFDPGSLLNNAVSKGHFILLPLSGDENYKNMLVLPRLDREGFIRELIQTGIPQERAPIISKECGRNLTILRRIEGFDYSKPAWVQSEWIADLVPALLAGKWDDSKEGDHIILEKLSGRSYGQFTARLQLLKQMPDAPIKQIGQQWRLSSPLDAWAYLSKYCSTDHFENLKAVCLTVLSEIDPALDLAIEQRYMAAIHKKEPAYSAWLREGLVQTLILIAVYGDQFHLDLPLPTCSWVDNVVLNLFRGANSRHWRSVSDVVQLLAEASPGSFMSMLEKAIDNQPDEILPIFEESSDPFTGGSRHSGYLWALEGIAWMPQQLGRVSLLLSRLTQIDPGGRLSNRPVNSLHQIFLPWMPQTLATPEERIMALQLLCDRVPEIAWNICVSLLPEGPGVAFPTFKFRWRLFDQNLQNFPTYGEIWSYQSAVLDILLKLASADLSKLSILINRIAKTLSLTDRNKIIQHISEIADQIVDHEYILWHSLRKLLYHHRSLPEAGWAIPENELIPIEVLFQRFTPKSVFACRIWVFDQDWPEFPDGNTGRKYSDPSLPQEIQNKRATFLKEIFDEIGIDGLLSIIPGIKTPYRYGEALATVVQEETHVDRLLALLRSDNRNEVLIIHSFVAKKHLLSGDAWIIAKIDQLRKEAYEEKDLVKMLLPLPFNRATWNIVDALPEGYGNIYWLQVNAWLHGMGPEDKNYALQKLVKVSRYRTVLKAASRFASEISTSILIEILDNAILANIEPDARLEADDATRLFVELDSRLDVEAKTMLKLEYIYTPVLLSYGNERGLLRIHEELSKNPSFFIDAVQIVYPADEFDTQRDQPAAAPSQDEAFKIQRFHEILYHWSKLPGLSGGGQIDDNFLRAWIAEVRSLAQTAHRIRMADAFIGKILVQAPLQGNRCPNDIVCEMVESINTDVIIRNYSASVYNQNGFTTRGVFDGGGIERTVASQLRETAGKLALKWPVMSSIYENLAKEYEARGRYEDNQASQIDHDY